jgi:proteic killer suppression protein
MVAITPGVILCQGVPAIEIAWSDHKLEKHCASDKAGLRHFGKQNWSLLRRRLDALTAAPTLKDMDGVPGNCHALTANRAGGFAVNLWGPYRLIVVPDHDPVPTLDDGGIDRTLVTRISITEVADYHGD